MAFSRLVAKTGIMFVLLLAGCEKTSAAVEEHIENLVITAHRIPVRSPEAGSAVSTVDRRLLDNRQSVFLTDILQDLPSIAVSRTAGFGSQTQVRIRGAEANHVLVMIDGVEANDPAGNDEFDFASLTSYDIERIEYVRGPQSALWGSDAAAGVINITTRQSSEALAGGGFIEGGSFGTFNGGGRISANSETAGINLSLSRIDTDSISAAANGTETDGYENNTVGLTSRWRPTQNTRLGFAARHTDSRTDIDDIDFATGLPADANRASDDSLLLLHASGAISLLDQRWDHSLRLTFLDSDREQLRDGSKDSSAAAEKTGIYYQTTWVIDTGDRGARQTAIFAIDHETQEFQQRGTATSFGDPNQDQKLDNTGYVLEYLVEPLSGLNLSASVRFDNYSDFENVTTYRLTSAWQLPESNTRLHASYGTGQKSPTFVERYGFFSDQFIGNSNLKPERSKGYDVGIEQRFFDGRFSIDLTYFNEALKDEIDGFVFDPDIGGFTADNLGGKSRRNGVELALRGRLSDHIEATASYSYTDARQSDALAGDSREIRRPRNMAALNVNYAMLQDRANLNINISHTGQQTDRIFPPPEFLSQTVNLGSYTLVDLAGSFDVTQRISLYARVENLFDQSYQNVFGFGAPDRGAHAGIRVRLGQ